MSTRRGVAAAAWVGVLCLVSSCAAGGGEEPAGFDPGQLVSEVRQRLSGDPDHDALRALLVQVKGDMVVEEYFGGADADDYWDLASVTKSVVSTLVGIAIGEGRIPGVDATLAELLPWHERAMSPALARATLQDLLTMKAGFPDSSTELLTDVAAPDPVAAILRHSDGPTGEFRYSDEGAHLVAAVLAEAAGSSPLEYARGRLFEPLGIGSEPAFVPRPSPTGRITDELAAQYAAAQFAWPADSQGTNIGWGILKLRPRDLVRLGQLFLDDGTWHGQQVVPASWVQEATSKQVDLPPDGYGYEWWITEADGAPAFQALGYGGQILEVVPDRDLVVVMATEVGLDRAPTAGFAATDLGFVVSDVIAPAVAGR